MKKKPISSKSQIYYLRLQKVKICLGLSKSQFYYKPSKSQLYAKFEVYPGWGSDSRPSKSQNVEPHFGDFKKSNNI